MALSEHKGDSMSGSRATTEPRSIKITWPASWGTTLLAIWLVVTGLLILLAPANAVLISLNAIVAIAAGVLLFLGR